MSHPHERDEWLMSQVAQDQPDCLEPLVRRYGTPLLTFITRMMGNVHRGEEIFQEVFLLVWAKRTLYEFPRPFKPWLYQIAVNRCRQELRLKRLGLVDMPFLDPLDIQAAPTPSPAEVAIQTETASLVQEALLTLPVKQREVVVMRVWGGLSYAQIAQATGRRESSVRSHMHHALTTLRARLEARLR